MDFKEIEFCINYGKLIAARILRKFYACYLCNCNCKKNHGEKNKSMKCWNLFCTAIFVPKFDEIQSKVNHFSDFSYNK